MSFLHSAFPGDTEAPGGPCGSRGRAGEGDNPFQSTHDSKVGWYKYGAFYM